MKKIGIVSKRGRQEPFDILRELLPWLRRQEIEPFVEEETARLLGVTGYPISELPLLADTVIVLGGDGTLLSVARLFCERGIPILGVNLGGLGFITEVKRTGIFQALENMIAGKYAIEERLMLSARVVRQGECVTEHTVLNDVVINKSALARIVSLRTKVNSAYITTFRADGLIVSTPTGSTAYCLAAGGPILYPTTNCIALTPICPHTLTNRPIVLPDTVVVEVMLDSPAEDVSLTLDGQVGFPLRENDVVAIEKSPYKTRLILPHERDYFQTLRTKLGWGEGGASKQ